jgi:hypothetical protein
MKITIEDFDNFLKPEKGWVRNRTGYEYVYDRVIPNNPKIMIKVLSSIYVETDKKHNKSEFIRVFAVRVKDGKICGGLVKDVSIFKTNRWQEDIKIAYKEVKQRAELVLKKMKK